MAAVRLTRYECERDLLPRVCARCGVPAETQIRFGLLTQYWYFALPALLVVCPPLFLIVMKRLFKKRYYNVPMCNQDADDWKWRDWLTTNSFIVVVVGAYIVAVPLIVLAPHGRPGQIPELALAGYWASMYLWWVPIAILWTRTVRTTKVMKRGVRLSGVHADFIRVLMADRVRSRESDPARTAWYGDDRDDFEEDWNVDGVFRPEVPPEATGQHRARSETE